MLRGSEQVVNMVFFDKSCQIVTNGQIGSILADCGALRKHFFSGFRILLTVLRQS